MKYGGLRKGVVSKRLFLNFLLTGLPGPGLVLLIILNIRDTTSQLEWGALTLKRRF